VLCVRQFSRDRGQGNIDEAEARQLSKAVRKPCKCIKLNSCGSTHTEHVQLASKNAVLYIGGLTFSDLTFGEVTFGELTFGEMTTVDDLTFCDLTFGDLVLSEMTFGEMTFGDLTFGEPTGHQNNSSNV